MEDVFYKRKLEDKIRKYLQRREILGVRGARQVGKTTLLKMIAEKLEGEKVFINLDLLDNRRTLEENPADFVKRFEKKGKKLYLFFDEIQRVKNAGEKLKIIYDEFPEVKMFISGSSSLEIKTNVLPFLVGRLLLFELYTFDFEEFMLAKDESLAKILREKIKSVKGFLEGNDEPQAPSFRQEFLTHWKEYAVFGGYPEVVKAKEREEKIMLLKNIYNLYLEKDVISFFRIEETTKFENFTKALAFGIASLLNLNSVASDVKISYKKAEEFLEILEHSYIISLVNPFHRNLVTELKKSKKIYFLDLGLRNAVIGNFLHFDSREDRGKLMENFVFRELITNFEEYGINYWRTAGKAEVDFVLSKGQSLIPVEVKLGGEKLTRGFYSFLRAYRPERALIITLDKFGRQKTENTLIYRIPVFYL